MKINMNKSGDGNISLSSLIKYVRNCQVALENNGDEDAALRFEILGDYLTEDYKPGQSLEFKTKHLGL